MTRHHGQLWTVIGGGRVTSCFWPPGAIGARPARKRAARSGDPGDATAGASDKSTPDSTDKTDAKTKAKPKPEFIVKSPAEWRKILTRVQFAVTREKATEPAFTGKYASGHFRGTFVCVCCDAAHVDVELFSSQAKFESGTGWPSFYQADQQQSHSDRLGLPRTRAAGRGHVPPLRRPSRTCLRRRSAADRPALLHQFRRHQADFS